MIAPLITLRLDPIFHNIIFNIKNVETGVNSDCQTLTEIELFCIDNDLLFEENHLLHLFSTKFYGKTDGYWYLPDNISMTPTEYLKKTGIF